MKKELNSVSLSVIIPVYNTKHYLTECVESVENQRVDGVEIILVDDESPDKAGELCDLLQRRFNNIVVIHKNNQGLGYARNSGLVKARGKYVTFLDSDDMVSSYYYRDMLKECEMNDLDICMSAGVINLYNEEEKVTYFSDCKPQIFLKNDECKRVASRVIGESKSKKDAICGSACMCFFKKKLLSDNGIFFVSERDFISEDIWFVLDALYYSNNVLISDIVGYKYRYNPNSLSRCYNPERFTRIVDASEQLIKRCTELDFCDFYDRVMIYFWINFEKCVNQEVRFNKAHAYENISIMCSNSITMKSFECLTGWNNLSYMHRLLFVLLSKKKIRTAIFLLSLYNLYKH